MTRRVALMLALAAALSACGRKGPLKTLGDDEDDEEGARNY